MTLDQIRQLVASNAISPTQGMQLAQNAGFLDNSVESSQKFLSGSYPAPQKQESTLLDQSLAPPQVEGVGASQLYQPPRQSAMLSSSPSSAPDVPAPQTTTGTSISDENAHALTAQGLMGGLGALLSAFFVMNDDKNKPTMNASVNNASRWSILKPPISRFGIGGL